MKSKKSAILSLILIYSMVFCPALVYCNPQGEQVVSGTATFDRSTPNTLNITTPSNKLIVNYDNFSIAGHETTNFFQPSSNAIALNRVISTNPSLIFGALNANGRIFIVNPNGVTFGPNSKVDVATLVASNLNISNEDFLAGNYSFSRFEGSVGASILNQGYIRANYGVALLGSAVENEGVIQTTTGSVLLASGDAITLNLDTAGIVSAVIADAVKNSVMGTDGKKIFSAVKNPGEIIAGKDVILTAEALDNVFDHLIDNTGIIEANTLNTVNARVVLEANGRVNVAGTIDAEGGKVIVNSEGADFSAEITADEGIFNMNDGDTNIDGGVYTGDQTWMDNLNIFLNSDVTFTSGNASILADNDNNGSGDATINASLSLNGGNVLVQGVNVYVNPGGSIATTGSGTVDVLARNQTSGVNSEIGVNGPISSVNGAITLRATNGENNVVDGGNYNNSSSTFAKVTISDTQITSDTGNVTLEAINSVTNTVQNITSYLYTSSNDAKISVNNSGGGTISTTGDISLLANNSVTNNTTAGSLTSYADHSYNRATVEVIGDTLTTTPGGANSAGTVTLTATNVVDKTVTANDIGNVYEGSQNKALIDVKNNGPGGISTDSGAVFIKASNTVSQTITAASISNVYFDYPVFPPFIYESNYNLAYVRLLNAPINSNSSGNINIDAINSANINVDVSGVIGNYNDSSKNIADIEIQESMPLATVATPGNITVNADNNVTKNTTANSITDTSTNSAEIFTNAILNTTSGNIALVADYFDINAPVSSQTGDITITNSTPGLEITVGGSTEKNDLEIGDDILGWFTTAGKVFIGSDNTGPVTVTNLDLVALGVGNDVVITASGASVLASVKTVGNFDFTTTSGPLTILTGTVESTEGSVNLTTLEGSILSLGAGPHLIAAADSQLNASGVVGGIGAPIDVLLTGGDLSVSIGGEIGSISGVITGTTPANTIIVSNTAPGSVYFNNFAIYPPAVPGEGPLPEQLAESANAMFFAAILPTLEEMAMYQTNGFGGPPLLYQPVTEADMSAFEALEMGEDAYLFINNALDLIGHEGLLPLEEPAEE